MKAAIEKLDGMELNGRKIKLREDKRKSKSKSKRFDRPIIENETKQNNFIVLIFKSFTKSIAFAPKSVEKSRKVKIAIAKPKQRKRSSGRWSEGRK